MIKWYNKLIITAVIAIICVVSFFILHKTPENKSKVVYSDTKSIHIENYIFTKFSSGKAVVRLYGVNDSDKSIEHFPVVVMYYSKDGRYLGKDEPDLLSHPKASLKPKGKLNAEINVAYPEGTSKVTVEVKRN